MYQSSDEEDNSEKSLSSLVDKNYFPSPSCSKSSANNSSRSRKSLINQLNKKYLAFSLISKCIILPLDKSIPENFTINYRTVTLEELGDIRARCHDFVARTTERDSFYFFVASFYRRILNSDLTRKMVQVGMLSFRDLESLMKSMLQGSNLNFSLSQKLFGVLCLDPEFAKGSFVEAERDQVYEQFRGIMEISPYESKNLYNILKLDNSEEQIAIFQREIECRIFNLEENLQLKNYGEFVRQREMEPLYEEEEKARINSLCRHLESLVAEVKAFSSISRRAKGVREFGSGARMEKKSYLISAFIMEARGIPKSVGRKVQCEISINGGQRQRTHLVDSCDPKWNSYCEFSTTKPVSLLKIKVCRSSVVSLVSKVIGKISIKITPFQQVSAIWYSLSGGNTHLRVIFNIYRPSNIHFGGYLSKSVKNSDIRRFYFLIIQAGTNTYFLSGYEEAKSVPAEHLNLDGYIVDYCIQAPEELGEDSRLCFYIVQEGSSLFFLAESEEDCARWVNLISKATRQNYVPSPFRKLRNRQSAGINIFNISAVNENLKLESENCDHVLIFKEIHRKTLNTRLGDDVASLGRLSPVQFAVLNNYCLRYCVDSSARNLCVLENYILAMERGMLIDASLLSQTYSFLADFFSIGDDFVISRVILRSDLQLFTHLHFRLIYLLESQLTRFRFPFAYSGHVFPFGIPEMALGNTLALYNQLSSSEFGSSADKIPTTTLDILKNASVLTYILFKNKTKVQGIGISQVPFASLPWKLWFEGIRNIGQECLELYGDTLDFYLRQSTDCNDFVLEHARRVWGLFGSDLRICLDRRPEGDWSFWDYFGETNKFFCSRREIFLSHSHLEWVELFLPLVDRYIESSLERVVRMGMESFSDKMIVITENGCSVVEVAVEEVRGVILFVNSLKWPESDFCGGKIAKIKQSSTLILKKLCETLFCCIESSIKKSPTNLLYVVPDLVIAVINSVIYVRDQTDLHMIEDAFFEEVLQNIGASLVKAKFVSVLNEVLSKLTKYDLGSLMGPILSLMKMESDTGEQFVDFLEANSEKMKVRIKDDIICGQYFKCWADHNLETINNWLEERKGATCHPEQVKNLILICKRMKKIFELLGVSTLHSTTSQDIWRRLNVDQMTNMIKQNSLRDKETIKSNKA